MPKKTTNPIEYHPPQTTEDNAPQQTVYAVYDQFSEYPVAICQNPDVAQALIPDWYVAGRVLPVTVPADFFEVSP